MLQVPLDEDQNLKKESLLSSVLKFSKNSGSFVFRHFLCMYTRDFYECIIFEVNIVRELKVPLPVISNVIGSYGP